MRFLWKSDDFYGKRISIEEQSCQNSFSCQTVLCEETHNHLFDSFDLRTFWMEFLRISRILTPPLLLFCSVVATNVAVAVAAKRFLCRAPHVFQLEQIMWCRSVAVALFLLPSACAFVPHRPLAVDGGSRTTTSLSMSASPPEDFMKRSQKVKSVLEDDEKPPKLFEDDLLEDMRESLLKLETRVKGGPGSLSMEEVDEFEAATQRILKEMKEFNASGGNTSPPGASSNAPGSL